MKSENFGFFIYNEEDDFNKNNEKTNRDKSVIAGCSGFIYYRCIYTDLLWVHKNRHGEGIATELLKAVEEHGRKAICKYFLVS